MGFIDGADTLVGNILGKVNRFAVKAGEELIRLQNTEWNALVAATKDARTWVRGAAWSALAPQASDPAPAGILDYVWLKTDGSVFLVSEAHGSQQLNAAQPLNGYVTTLLPKPSAAAGQLGRLVYEVPWSVEGGYDYASVALYLCVLTGMGTYTWKQVAWA